METCGRFGLLSHCSHEFCLPCIRSWRGTSSENKKELVRACPLCRVDSFFVIPCDRMVTESNKHQIIEAYKNKMGQIECKHYNRGQGQCPFGSSCFYAHLNQDGTLSDQPKIRAQESKLSDFLFAELS